MTTLSRPVPTLKAKVGTLQPIAKIDCPDRHDCPDHMRGVTGKKKGSLKGLIERLREQREAIPDSETHCVLYESNRSSISPSPTMSVVGTVGTVGTTKEDNTLDRGDRSGQWSGQVGTPLDEMDVFAEEPDDVPAQSIPQSQMLAGLMKVSRWGTPRTNEG